jgi:hypothetical protein
MKLAALLAWAALLAPAQDTDRFTVPFSNPSAPKRLQCSLVQGSITVRAHRGSDVIVDSQGGAGYWSRKDTPPGMRRLEPGVGGVEVEERDNVIRIGGMPSRNQRLLLTVPVDTSLKLSTVNNGDILVEGVSGEIDVNNVNGNIQLRDVSGAVVAHTLNGKLVAVLSAVTAGKAMSFSTLNGNVDVTLPADVKANLKLKSDNGDIFTDFEVTLKPSSTPQSGARDSRGRYRLRTDKTTHAAINGGGPDFSFTTLNGSIYIRKGAAGGR